MVMLSLEANRNSSNDSLFLSVSNSLMTFGHSVVIFIFSFSDIQISRIKIMPSFFVLSASREF